MVSDDEAMAEDLYNAYGEHADWEAHDGRPMPEWADLPHITRDHWVAVAEKARELAGGPADG